MPSRLGFLLLGRLAEPHFANLVQVAEVFGIGAASSRVLESCNEFLGDTDDRETTLDE